MPYIVFALILLSCQVVSAEQSLEPPITLSEPAKGVLLVADRSMPDPRFQQTVILLLEHNDQRGTLGLVLNRPSDLTLADALPDSMYQDKSLPLSWGGPVGQRNIFMLLRTGDAPAESDPVFADIVWSASAAVLETLLSGEDDSRRLRLFFGVSSWAPGQLAGELAHGGWKLFEAQTGAVFHDGDPTELWRHFIEAPVQILARLSHAP